MPGRVLVLNSTRPLAQWTLPDAVNRSLEPCVYRTATHTPPKLSCPETKSWNLDPSFAFTSFRLSGSQQDLATHLLHRHDMVIYYLATLWAIRDVPEEIASTLEG